MGQPNSPPSLEDPAKKPRSNDGIPVPAVLYRRITLAYKSFCILWLSMHVTASCSCLSRRSERHCDIQSHLHFRAELLVRGDVRVVRSSFVLLLRLGGGSCLMLVKWGSCLMLVKRSDKRSLSSLPQYWQCNLRIY